MEDFIKAVKQGEQPWEFLPKTNTYRPEDLEPYLAKISSELLKLEEETAQLEKVWQYLAEEKVRALDRQSVLKEQQAARREANKDADYDYENDRDNALSDE